MTERKFDREGVKRHVAKTAAKTYAEWTTQEDLLQELHTYDIANSRRIEKWLDGGETFRVFRAYFGVAKQFAEREKAAQSGYHFEDVAWYDPTRLADIVPLAMNSRWDGLTGEMGDAGQPVAKVAGSEGGTLLAMVLDVRRVLRGTKFLATDFDPSTTEGMSRLQWLCVQLGGEYPVAEGYTPSRRKAMTNNQAIARTGDLY